MKHKTALKGSLSLVSNLAKTAKTKTQTNPRRRHPPNDPGQRKAKAARGAQRPPRWAGPTPTPTRPAAPALSTLYAANTAKR